MLAPHLSDPDALHVLCSSAEFDQLKVRPEELPEIDSLKKKTIISIRGAHDDTSGKVNILLQSYLNKSIVQSFTLQSDMNYVATNASRITRALFEICLRRGWSNLSKHYLTLAKSIDRGVMPGSTPLAQFDELPRDIIQKIEGGLLLLIHVMCCDDGHDDDGDDDDDAMKSMIVMMMMMMMMMMVLMMR